MVLDIFLKKKLIFFFPCFFHAFSLGNGLNKVQFGTAQFMTITYETKSCPT
jgi:hypothetical protein